MFYGESSGTVLDPSRTAVSRDRNKNRTIRVPVPQEYLDYTKKTPRMLFLASDWYNLLHKDPSVRGLFSQDVFREAQVLEGNSLAADDPNWFCFASFDKICSIPLSIEAMEHGLFGMPRLIVTDSVRKLPCFRYSGKCGLYNMCITSDDMYLDGSRDPKARNVALCVLLYYAKTGIRLLPESSKRNYTFCRDCGQYGQLIVGPFTSEGLHIQLYPEFLGGGY